MSSETTSQNVATQDPVDQVLETPSPEDFQGHADERPDPEPVDVANLGAETENLGVLLDIDMKVTVELGRTQMKIRDILDLSPGSVVELGKSPSEPVDLMVNGVLTARGEVVVVDDHFAMRITKLLRRGEHIHNLI